MSFGAVATARTPAKLPGVFPSYFPEPSSRRRGSSPPPASSERSASLLVDSLAQIRPPETATLAGPLSDALSAMKFPARSYSRMRPPNGVKTALSVTHTSTGPAGKPPVEPLPRRTVQPFGCADAGEEHQPPIHVPSGLKIEMRPADPSATHTCL